MSLCSLIATRLIVPVDKFSPMKTLASLYFSAIALFLSPPGMLCAEEAAIWHTDYREAVDEARLEKKKLLIVFTGTEWIDICRTFHDDILSKPAFTEPVSAHFSLLNLEYPKDNKLPREEAVQKSLLRDAYRVRGFPTIILTDLQGRPIGLNGYQPVTAEEYAKQILDTDLAHEVKLAALTEAKSMEGIAKAKRLSEGLPDLPGNLLARYYRSEMEEIISADPGDTLKVAVEFGRAIADLDYSQKMEKLARESNWAEMEKLSDLYMVENKLEGPALQKVLLNKAGVLGLQKKSEELRKTLDRVVVIDPSSDAGIKAKRMIAEIEAGESPESSAE